MIPTEYLRQVPIKHWLPITHLDQDGRTVSYAEVPYGQIACKEVITGYKVQMAWFCGYLTKEQRFSESEKVALEHGDEVEAFEWLDLPVKE